MLVKLSDFLLEQEVSNSDISDIVIEQAMAEFDVCLKLTNAYYKQLLMEEYSDTPPVDTIQEAKIIEISDRKQSEEEKKAEDEKDVSTNRFVNVLKSVLKTVGNFFNAIGKKIEKLLKAHVKLGKNAIKHLKNISDEDAEKFIRYLAARSKTKSRSALYTSYNITDNKYIINELVTITKRFEAIVSMFAGQIHYSNKKTDSYHENDIAKANKRFREIAMQLSEFDKLNEYNPEQYGGSSNITTEKFIRRIRDYIAFYDTKDVQNKLKEIIKNIDQAQSEIKTLDVSWNYTKDYRWTKDMSITKTDILRDRSDSTKYVEIRNMIDNINSMAKGNKRSVGGRIDDITKKYLYVVEYFVRGDNIIKSDNKDNKDTKSA